LIQNKPSILLLSRLVFHGRFLNKLLSKYYHVIWVGQSFPFSLTLVNISYIISHEFWDSLVNFGKSHFRLIIVQFVSLDGIIAVLFKRVLKTKLVLFAVGSDILRIQEHPFTYPIIRFIIKQSDFVFCASALIEKKLKLLGCDPSSLLIVPSIMDMQDFQQYSGPKVYDIVTIGSLDSNKNQSLLLKASENLAHKNILIIGDGPMREVLESEATRKQLSIVFLGCIPHRQVLRELQKSRIYVHTSKSEGLPVSVLEAMFLGLPVILIERPYIYDLEHRYGFKFCVVKDGSINDLTNMASEVLENYEVEHRKAEINRQKILDLNSKGSKEIMEVLDKICCYNFKTNMMEHNASTISTVME
jgi:glycosyltransferase involved in cell wall biosynthesis